MVRIRATNTTRRRSSNGSGSRQRSNRSLRQESTPTCNHHWWCLSLQKDAGDHSYLQRILGSVGMILVGMAIGMYLVDHIRHGQQQGLVDGTYYTVLNAISTPAEKPVTVVTDTENSKKHPKRQEKNNKRRDEEEARQVERRKQRQTTTKEQRKEDEPAVPGDVPKTKRLPREDDKKAASGTSSSKVDVKRQKKNNDNNNNNNNKNNNNNARTTRDETTSKANAKDKLVDKKRNRPDENNALPKTRRVGVASSVRKGSSSSSSSLASASSSSSYSHPLEATGGKAWFWSPKSARDLDHQRQGMFVTWIIAYYTGHAVEHKALPNFKHSNFWNLPALEKYVHVDKVPSDVADSKIKRKGLTRLYANTTFATVEQVQELKSRNNVGFFSHKLGWNFLSNTFPWLDPYEGPANSTFRRMIKSFTYCEKIQRLADKAIEQMVGSTTDEPKSRMNNFIGLEVLSHRKPAVDCKRYKSNTNPKDWKAPLRVYNLNASFPVWPGSCADVDWSNLLAKSKFPAVLAAKSSRRTPVPVYVAHDAVAVVRKKDNDNDTNNNNNNKGSSSSSSSSFDKNSINANDKHYKVFTRSDFDFLSPRRPEIVSAVEQVIMTRAAYFVGSMFSTWSEYVIFQRIYSNNKVVAADGKRNYEIWKRKFSYVMKPPEDLAALSREQQRQSFLVVPSTKNKKNKKAGTSSTTGATTKPSNNKDSSSSKNNKANAKSRVAKSKSSSWFSTTS